MQIDIIGAGIGGLTSAIALKQKGFKTNVFEQTATIKSVGAGIILANNAMQVYEQLGLRHIIEENGNPISSMNITTSNLNQLSKMDLTYFERKNKVKNIAIHRGKLQQILLDKLNPSIVHLNHQLKSIKQSSGAYQLKFNNDQEIESNIILGADGLNSTVRQQLFPNNSVRNANQICWRGITDFYLPAQYKNELNEAWGKSERFGFVQIAKHKVYWYALKTIKKDKNEFSVKHIENYFKHFDPIIKAIIASTNKHHINTAEIADLKPTKHWYKDNVCLIGDAAHATTPNMGQGACQAIEDAYVLAACMEKNPVTKAFEAFQKLRLPKAHKVVKTSWMVGKMAHISNPILIGMRNQLLRMTPSAVSRKQNEAIFQLATI